MIGFGLPIYSSQVRAQGFNCRLAKTPDEVLICQDQALSRLDERMTSLYSQVQRNSSGSQRAMLERDQRSWLRLRMGCERDRNCIEQSYQRRIQQLTTEVSPAATSKPITCVGLFNTY